MLDLLWKFYEMNQNFSAAARVLAKLADKHGYVFFLFIRYFNFRTICLSVREIIEDKR